MNNVLWPLSRSVPLSSAQLSEASRADLGLWSLLDWGGFLALSPKRCVNLEQFCNFPEGIPDPPVLGQEIRTPPCGLFPDEWYQPALLGPCSAQHCAGTHSSLFPANPEMLQASNTIERSQLTGRSHRELFARRDHTK